MQTDFLKLYLESNKTLARTLSIKIDRHADTINAYLKLKYGNSIVDDNDKTTWKYYKNLAGEYHVTDTPMEITSLDTQEKIIFSKDVLLEHPATVEAYQYQTRYYRALVMRYPQQETLILGILYPADKDKAINSENGTILSYPSYLVEPQEATLMVELESYIKRYLVRWDVQAFGVSESLYNSAQFAVMCLNILPKITNLRLKRCKTNEVHTFHVRQYLASHGRLDRFMPYMTLSQVLYLYRDIRYIERNAGKVTQFRTLIDKLLTERYIPLGEFSVRHLNNFDEKYYPHLNVRRKGLNPLYNTPEMDYFKIESLFAKEAKLVIDNPRYLEQNSESMIKLFQNSSSSIVQTKDLESSMFDYSNAVPDPLDVVLLREWAHLVTTGKYNTYVTFKNPVTSDDVTLSSLDAFIYMYYIFLRSIGLTIVKLPPYINIKHRMEPIVTVERMLSVVDGEFKDLPTMAKQILSRQPVIGKLRSIKKFFDTIHIIYEEGLLHWYTTSSTQDLYKRGQVANMILTMYGDTQIDFPVETENMDKWLSKKGLPPYKFTYEEAQKYIKTIFMASTGLSEESAKLLRNIQAALIGAITQLSSYSIQFIREMIDSNIKILNWPAIRIGHPKFKFSSQFYIESEVTVIDYSGKQSHGIHIESVVDKNFNEYTTSMHASFVIMFTVEAITKSTMVRNLEIYNRPYYIDVTYATYDPNISARAKFAGWEYYLALTDQQKSEIKSIYQ